MKFLTVLTAIDNTDGELKDFVGEIIEAINWDDAEAKIEEKPYLTIVGVLTDSIDEDGNKTNYENLN